MSLLLRAALLALLCAPAMLAAQEPAPQAAPAAALLLEPPPLPIVDVRQPTAGQRFGRMVLPAVLGSGLGLVAGGYFGSTILYDATNWGSGGDDPGLEPGLLGAVIGATLGSMIGAYAARDYEHPVSLSRAFIGSTVGIGVGVLTGIAGAHLADFGGLILGFSMGQGTTTALFAVPYP
jgi:uncharacterized membrane protein YeaQ/YmgE (transglycosylase-associated protein family)